MKRSSFILLSNFASKSVFFSKLSALIYMLFYNFNPVNLATTNARICPTLNDAIELFVDEEKRQDKKYIKKLKFDVVFSMFRHHMNYWEYFFYKFYEKSEFERHNFVSSYESIPFRRKIKKEHGITFPSKWENYLQYKDFYKRNVIFISNSNDLDKFVKFVQDNKTVILKSEFTQCGKSIVKFVYSDYENAVKFFNSLEIEKSNYLVEEFLVQGEELAKFHPQSVNTVRITTYFNKDKLTVLQSFIRFGCGDSIVDNAALGGITATIDYKTGIIDSEIFAEKYKISGIFHPDTHEQILGYNLPQWPELKKMIENVVRVNPERKIVGWDFAYSKKGWCVIELNSAPTFQWAEKGVRKEFEKMKNGEI